MSSLYVEILERETRGERRWRFWVSFLYCNKQQPITTIPWLLWQNERAVILCSFPSLLQSKRGFHLRLHFQLLKCHSWVDYDPFIVPIFPLVHETTTSTTNVYGRLQVMWETATTNGWFKMRNKKKIIDSNGLKWETKRKLAEENVKHKLIPSYSFHWCKHPEDFLLLFFKILSSAKERKLWCSHDIISYQIHIVFVYDWCATNCCSWQIKETKIYSSPTSFVWDYMTYSLPSPQNIRST